MVNVLNENELLGEREIKTVVYDVFGYFNHKKVDIYRIIILTGSVLVWLESKGRIYKFVFDYEPYQYLTLEYFERV